MVTFGTAGNCLSDAYCSSLPPVDRIGKIIPTRLSEFVRMYTISGKLARMLNKAGQAILLTGMPQRAGAAVDSWCI